MLFILNEMTLPVTPTFEVPFEANNQKEVLTEVGTVNIAGRPGLRKLSFSSFFPAKHSYVCDVPPKNPYDYVLIIEKWMRSGKPINVVITDTVYNFDALIDSFNVSEEDGSGDVQYTLELSEYVKTDSEKVADIKKGLQEKSGFTKEEIEELRRIGEGSVLDYIDELDPVKDKEMIQDLIEIIKMSVNVKKTETEFTFLKKHGVYDEDYS